MCQSEDESGKLCNDCNGSRSPEPITPTPSTSPTLIQASFDGAWAKRGRAYNSLTGVGAAIGANTGKIIAYGTRNKRCMVCHNASAKGQTLAEHDCRKNWLKSSKAMEPSIACEVVKTINDSDLGVKVGTLIGDEDAATIKAVHEEVDADVEKRSDVSHIKRSLGNALFNIKNQHKELSDSVIGHVKKCFAYALQQNRGQAESLAAAIVNVPQHLFGDHSSCGEWCGSHADPTGYKHHGLPRGQPLKSSSLRDALAAVFAVFARNAAKIAPMGSSQVNEAFHNIVASKAPKSRHYGGSQSSDFRVAAAVCQQNEGYGYVCGVMADSALSPSRSAERFASLRQSARERQSSQAGDRMAKRRRLELKASRRQSHVTQELREGTSYAPSCSLAELDSAEIPAHIEEPALVCATSLGSSTKII